MFIQPYPKYNTSKSNSLIKSLSQICCCFLRNFRFLQPTQNCNVILVSNREKGNSLLKYTRNVRWTFVDVVCDFLLCQTSCALYLSLRYHLLHPEYLYYIIRELQKNYKLSVVLCHIDVEDVVKPLLKVTKTALLHDCTLLCGWSLEECKHYLETIKSTKTNLQILFKANLIQTIYRG